MERILSDDSVSISELKRNPSAVIGSMGSDTLAVLVHNKPAAYLLSAKAYGTLLERLDDLELASIVRSRQGEPCTEVSLDDL